MSDSTVPKIRLVEMLIEKGTSTILAAVLLWAFWVVVLKPAGNERAILVETLRQNTIDSQDNLKANRIAVEESAASNKLIADNVALQSDTLLSIRDEILNQTELRKVAMSSMSAFAQEMREVNPGNSKKLDELMKVIKEGNHKEKLDHILQEIELLHKTVKGLE